MAALEIVQHFSAAISSLGWTMFFHFDFYPADLMAVIAGRRAAEAGEIVQQWLIGLISNSADCITDTKARESASKMLERCQQRSDLYRANGSKRYKARTKPEKAEPKETPDQTKKAAQKPPKAPLFGFALVNVTEKEKADLERRFGGKLQRMAEILHNYKESSGKKYKSDAAALRGWVADKVAQERRNGSKGFKAEERARDAQNAAEMLTDEQKRFYGLD